MNLYRIVDTPLALHARAAVEMMEKIRIRVDRDGDDRIVTLFPGERIEGLAPRADVVDVTRGREIRSYDVVEGVALVPVTGVLVHGQADGWWGDTSYGEIEESLSSAMDDPEVRGVAMQIKSPGGEVSGLFDLGDTVYQMRGRKPIWSIVDDHAYSAAYALASASDRILVPRTGGVGSIGVVTMHVDLSAMLEKWGLKVTIVQFGKRKTDYSPVKPLESEAQERLQSNVDAVGEMFVEMVSRNRGIDSKRVRGTEAGTFMGADGVGQGLADGVMSPREALAALIAQVS